jgi:hypothetical protein
MSDRNIKRIERPQFRAPVDMQIALARFCADNFRTPSQVLTLALRHCIPEKYFAEARSAAKQHQRIRR